jgi:hypothetical protein
MQPPPLTVIAHGKLSFHMCFKFNRPRPNIKKISGRYAASFSPPSIPSACFAFCGLPGGRCVSLLFETNETRKPRLRNLDTEPPLPYCYELRSDNHLESVANAHTAADLHVRLVS